MSHPDHTATPALVEIVRKSMNHQWTPADDLAAAAEEAAKLRVFDAAYQDSEPHWQDDDASRAAKGFAAGFGLSIPLWALLGAAVWWAL